MQTPKIVIIGMGYLMEYLLPCYTLLLGGEDRLADHVLATTLDARSIAEKQKRFPFPIQLGKNREALEQMKPDLILFAPPPDAVPTLTEEVLAPYFSACRAAGRPLPEIYAFPPSPHAGWYLDRLGADVAAVNIIPKTESGKRDEELTMLSFPQDAPWTGDRLDRLHAFCSPMGGVEALPAPVFYSQVGCRCVAGTLPWVFFTAVDRLRDKWLDLDHAQMARYMGKVLAGGAAGDEGLPRTLCLALEEITRQLRSSIVSYLESVGMNRAAADQMVVSKLKADMALCAGKRRMDIVRQVKCYATKGGIAELALLEYGTLLEERMEALFDSYPHLVLDDRFRIWFEQQVSAMCAHASHRAATLHEPLPLPDFGPEHSRELMRLVSSAAARLVGEDAAEGVTDAMVAWLEQCPEDKGWEWRTAGVYHGASRWLTEHLDALTAGDVISEARLDFGRRYGQGAAYLPARMEGSFDDV